MEFEHARTSVWTIVLAVLFLVVVIAACLGGVWLIWDNYLSDSVGKIVEFLS